ncbi:Protein-disulfide isomerase [Arthrobacter subterraneus]|uniref:Protein-disulfide isomerase n=1 Tax=Arthrobacter subterraneus TaxID=335973 RepID=A0A1G8QBQ4_9MICC|nr:Protein-disulfide isomerase [Arthrobacter subterraneus]
MSSSHSPAPERPSRRALVASIAVAVSVLLILLIGIIASRTGASQEASTTTTPPGQSAAEEPLDLSRRAAGDPTALGEVDAPVVLIEYADYRCPFCGLFSRDTLPSLVDKYVESGDLRIEWRDLPVFGEQSFSAAVAGRAAGEQDRFWEFNKAVFAEAPKRGHIDLPEERLLELAQEAGVPDLEKFRNDLQSEELAAAVTNDAQEAASLGATGTPTFLVNDTPLIGAQPLAAFEQAIEGELKEAGQR